MPTDDTPQILADFASALAATPAGDTTIYTLPNRRCFIGTELDFGDDLDNVIIQGGPFTELRVYNTLTRVVTVGRADEYAGAENTAFSGLSSDDGSGRIIKYNTTTIGGKAIDGVLIRRKDLSLWGSFSQSAYADSIGASGITLRNLRIVRDTNSVTRPDFALHLRYIHGLTLENIYVDGFEKSAISVGMCADVKAQNLSYGGANPSNLGSSYGLGLLLERVNVGEFSSILARDHMRHPVDCATGNWYVVIRDFVGNQTPSADLSDIMFHGQKNRYCSVIGAICADSVSVSNPTYSVNGGTEENITLERVTAPLVYINGGANNTRFIGCDFDSISWIVNDSGGSYYYPGASTFERCTITNASTDTAPLFQINGNRRGFGNTKFINCTISELRSGSNISFANWNNPNSATLSFEGCNITTTAAATVQVLATTTGTLTLSFVGNRITSNTGGTYNFIVDARSTTTLAIVATNNFYTGTATNCHVHNSSQYTPKTVTVTASGNKDENFAQVSAGM